MPMDTYEQFVHALEQRREDVSPLRWAAGQGRDPRIAEWLARWLREQRASTRNQESR